MLLICHNNQKDSIKKKCEEFFLEGGTTDFAEGANGRDEAVGVGVADFAGGFGGGESGRKRFGEVHDIDITHLNIDWVGDSEDLNIKKINGSESSCWNLDLMGFGRESEGDSVRENIAFGDIETD